MKKITAVLVATLMILSSFTVLAAETMAKPDALYNYETGKLTVSGVADSNSTLTVYVVNPSFTKEDIGANNGALQNIRKITADKDGKYS